MCVFCLCVVGCSNDGNEVAAGFLSLFDLLHKKGALMSMCVCVSDGVHLVVTKEF